MKILVIEDENATRYYIKELMLNEKHEVMEAYSGNDGLIKLTKEEPDLVILDVMLPDIDGFYVCEQIRKKPEKYGTPLILMLTAKDTIDDVVFGIDAGADDYMKKPFDSRELTSRVAALFRRRGIFSKVYKYDEIVVDTEKNIVTENGIEIELTPKEFELLLYLIVNKGITITRDKLMEDVWGMPYFEGNRTIDTYVKKVKKKLETIKDKLISIRGFGYKLENK